LGFFETGYRLRAQIERRVQENSALAMTISQACKRALQRRAR